MINSENLNKHLNPKVFLSGVVILTPGHLRFFNAVMSDLTNQSLAFSEIVVVCSGFNQSDFDVVLRQVKDYKTNYIHVLRVGPGPAGKNRNIGLDSVSDKAVLVMIHDADDRYPYFRNQAIYKQFLKTEFDALLHLYLPTTELGAGALLDYLNNSTLRLTGEAITPRELFSLTFGSGRVREEEELAIVDTSLKLPASATNMLVQHAHITLRRSSTREFKYHEKFLPRNEDGLLVRDLLFSGLNVFVLCRPLSVYLVGASSFGPQASRYQSVLNWKRLFYSKLKEIEKKLTFFRT